MKTYLKTLFCAILVFLLGYYEQVFSAVTVSDITKAQFDTYAADTPKVSWSITLFPGASGGIFFPEIRVYRSDGTSVLLNHDWHRPEQILLSHNSAGKLGLNVGSDIAEIYPIIGFDAIAFQIKDGTLNGITELKSNSFDGSQFRNLFADDPLEMTEVYDQTLVTGLGDTFNYSGALELGTEGYVGGEDAYLKIVGFTIPEPSSITFLFLGLVLITRRKR